MSISARLLLSPATFQRLLGAIALFFIQGDPLAAQATAQSLLGEPFAPIAIPSAPTDPDAYRLWEEALNTRGRRVLVSLSERRLWIFDGSTPVYSAPVAVGKSVVLEYETRTWNFATPRGRRSVIGKEKNPIWIPPDWHYVELALAQGWKLAEPTTEHAIPLSDGSKVTVQGDRIGRLLPDGSFVPVPVGEEAVFEGTLFMPPIHTENRRIPGMLGRYKLDLGDAYYLHGTPYSESIGTATTHGCIRMRDADIEHLFRTLEVGTPVFIF